MIKRLSKNSILFCSECKRYYTYYQFKYNRITNGKGICIDCFVKYGNETYLRILDRNKLCK